MPGRGDASWECGSSLPLSSGGACSDAEWREASVLAWLGASPSKKSGSKLPHSKGTEFEEVRP